MHQLYEIATLSFPILSAPEASEGARAWATASEAKGVLLGSWRTGLGLLGRLLVLRGFADADELGAERRRALLSANPFNAGSIVTALDMDGYAPFPFLPPVAPRAYGKVLEFRTYWLKPGGLPATLEGWERAALRSQAYVTGVWPPEGGPETYARRCRRLRFPKHTRRCPDGPHQADDALMVPLNMPQRRPCNLQR